MSQISDEEVREKMLEILIEVTGIDSTAVTDDDSWSERFGVESFALMGILLETECVFGILIPDEDVHHFDNLKLAVNYVMSRLQDKQD
jgi:acyl carrier protein